MRVSVIIPTYNRQYDLKECLESLYLQTYQPKEIIVVDNAQSKDIESMIQKKALLVRDKDIELFYLANKKNSLTAARNLGVQSSTGEIILFLDDDVILSTKYIEEIIKIYQTYPNALGVQGLIIQEGRRAYDKIYKIFYGHHHEPNNCRVLPSVSSTFPSNLNQVIQCQWLSGANHSYKRIVFEDFQYDERLQKYSEGEDLEMSYRVFKSYPGSLFITPFATLVHNVSSDGRALGKELIYMQEVYGLYLFFKLFRPTLQNKIIYFWSRIGRLLLNIGRFILTRNPEVIQEIFYITGAYLYSLRHLSKIREGNLEFFNHRLMKGIN